MKFTLFPVEVIFLSGMDGEIRPLRIRASEGMDDILIGNVDAILSTRQGKRIGSEYFSFLCRIRSGVDFVILELRYFVTSHSWFVVKMGD